MSIKAGVGIAQGEDAYTAGANACQEAFDKLGESSPNVVLVFSSVEYDQEKMLQGVRSVSRDAILVGCSTAGEITTEGPAKHHSVAVMALRGDGVSFFAGVGEHIVDGPSEAGKAVADAVRGQAPAGKLDAFIMLPDVLVGNGADIVRGVLQGLGAHFPIVGGAAGDDFEFKKTYQYLNDKLYSGAVVGLGLSGSFKMGIGVKHGWVPVGSPKRVTKSIGSVLHELDGAPAIKIYEDYFGADSAAEIPEGAEIRLMIGSREEAIKVAKEAATLAVSELNGGVPKAVLIFNCIARSKLFGERSGEEISAIQEAVGRDTPLIGFYTYGEQAPLGGEVRNLEKCNSAFHNETVVICVLGD